MAEMMTFPETFDKFAEDYGFVDKKEVYTNGSELIQVFRVKQWLDHEAGLKKAEDECFKAASDTLTDIAHYLLGKDWYSEKWNFEDICTDIFEAIRARYKSVNEDPVRKWRHRHKRCSFCNHFEPYPDVPCVIRTGENGWCRAKSKQVNYSRRRICRLFELKGKLK